MNAFTVVQGSRRPARLFRLTENGRPFDLSAATNIAFVFKSGATRRSGTCSIVDAKAGLVRYDWQVGDTDMPGEYACRFVVTIGGLEEHVPNGGVGHFNIVAAL